MNKRTQHFLTFYPFLTYRYSGNLILTYTGFSIFFFLCRKYFVCYSTIKFAHGLYCHVHTTTPIPAVARTQVLLCPPVPVHVILYSISLVRRYRQSAVKRWNIPFLKLTIKHFNSRLGI